MLTLLFPIYHYNIHKLLEINSFSFFFLYKIFLKIFLVNFKLKMLNFYVEYKTDLMRVR